MIQQKRLHLAAAAMALVLLLTACAAQQSAKAASGLEEVSSSDSAKAEENSVFEAVFASQSEKIGTLSDQEFLNELEGTGFDIQTKQVAFEKYVGDLNFDYRLFVPHELVSVVVADPTSPDYVATLWFYPDSQSQYTLAEMRFGNDNFYVTISDHLHSADKSYYTYAIVGEPRQATVHSLANLHHFMWNEVPE